MEYIVTVAVNGHYLVKVDAENLNDVRRFAEEELSEADFGELSEITDCPFCAEDEDGELHDL